MSDEEKMLISALLGFLSALVLQLVAHILAKGRRHNEQMLQAIEAKQKADMAVQAEIRNRLMAGVSEFAEKRERKRIVEVAPDLVEFPYPNILSGKTILLAIIIGIYVLSFIVMAANWGVRSSISMLLTFSIVFSLMYWVTLRLRKR